MKHIAKILFILAACFYCCSAYAQEESYKYDFGVHAGMSGYLGDANQSNMFKRPGYAAGLSFRYLPNSRMAVRVVLNTSSLSGNSADFGTVFPDGQSYSFKSQECDLTGRFEFNFLPYGIGETYKHLKRISPYIAAGVGVSLSICDGRTAGAPAIPLAVGVKYKLAQRWNLGLEFCMTKVFGDKVDGELTDLYEIKSSFIKNTDWHSNIALSITYEFGKRCVTCHYVD